jgi:hypothetical protein
MKLNLIFKKNILGIFLLLIISSGLTALPAKAQEAPLAECPDDAIKLSTYFPGLEKCTKTAWLPDTTLEPIKKTYYYIQNLAEYIIKLYNFALVAAGILALVMITFGGYLWLTAGGNPSRVGKAKEYIVSAITGLILALGAFTILYFINPKIINPSLKVASVTEIPVDKFCENIINDNPKLLVQPEEGECGQEGEVFVAPKINPNDPDVTISTTTCLFTSCFNGGYCADKTNPTVQSYIAAHPEIQASPAKYVCVK